MTDDRPSRWRKLLILPPILVGILVLVWLAKGRQPPALVAQGEPTRTVRVVTARQLDLVPTAEGYGPVRPARVWSAVSQVAGRLVSIHERLRDGEILLKDTELLRIDPVDYELALAQANAELAELAVQESNARSSLAIEQRKLELAQQDLERQRKLVRQGTISQSTADEAERTALASRAAVQNQENTLSLLPVRKRLLEAKVARSRRDLEHTLIRAPFDLKVNNLKVEADQFVTQGQTLFAGDAVDRVEIEAQVALSSLRKLFLGRAQEKIDMVQLNGQLPAVAGLDPLVRLDLGGHVAEWQARFVRFADSVDPETRTIGVVVAVDNPYEKVKPGYRPPLSKGMFVQVVLRGSHHRPRLVVPRAAVRDGAVLVADGEDRLRRKPVQLLYSQGEVSVIASGLEAGERVVVSDLVPAVEGMLLQVQPDQALQARIAALESRP